MKTLRTTIFILITIVLPNQSAYSQLSQEDLAKIAQNPLANIVSMPFQNNTSFGIGPFDRTQNITNIQPVLPFAEGKFIVRAIVPIINQPNIFSDSGNFNGIGDVNLSVFYANNKRKINWGIGPVFNLPTSGENLGLKEWGVGPSFVAVIKPSNWVIGVLINNVWSLESDQSAFTIQPFINYNLPKGYYLSTSPKVTANWQAESGNKWTIPIGMAFGKLIKPKGFLPLNVQAGAYYNIETPEPTGSDWTLRTAVTVLIPKAIFKKKNNNQ